MTKNNIAISSLAMDLKRVAVGYYGDSNKTARRFSQEALKRIEENSYGKCSVCGKNIEEKRLDANPFAETCIKHMEAYI